MKPAGALALVLYAIGIPAVFLAVLVKYRTGIKEDQRMKLKGQGNSASSNPHYGIRRRFQKL
jgi:hypothetical protein